MDRLITRFGGLRADLAQARSAPSAAFLLDQTATRHPCEQRPSRIRIVSVLLLAFAVVLGSCSGGESALPDPASATAAGPSPDTTTTGVTAPASDGLVDRYRAFWDTRFEANSEPVQADHPALREYATGAQLESVIAETRQNAEDGVAFRRSADSVYERRIVVVERGGGVATLQDCVTSDGIVYRVVDGHVIDDEVVTRNISATMRKVDGVWKLAASSELQEWEGVAGCALSDDF